MKSELKTPYFGNGPIDAFDSLIFDTFGRGWLRRNDATRVLSLGAVT